jgi:hypothetical protein
MRYKICKHVNGLGDEHYTISQCWLWGLLSCSYTEHEYSLFGYSSYNPKYKTYRQALRKIKALQKEHLQRTYKRVECEVIE